MVGKLFTNNCPKCRMLKELLDKNNMAYTTEYELGEIVSQGIFKLPIFKYRQEYFDYDETIELLRGLKNRNGKRMAE